MFFETSHLPLSTLSIYILAFPDHLQVLTPRGAGDALVHSARGEIPDEDPYREGGLIITSNTYMKWSRTQSQETNYRKLTGFVSSRYSIAWVGSVPSIYICDI